jgi:hypothetical protein
VSEQQDQPLLYQVSYSEAVRAELRRLGAVAGQHGLGAAYVAALREANSRLRIYPQFGEPLYDLKLRPAQLWIGSIFPLVLRYTLDEERRLVMVVAPFLLLPRSGL